MIIINLYFRSSTSTNIVLMPKKAARPSSKKPADIVPVINIVIRKKSTWQKDDCLFCPRKSTLEAFGEIARGANFSASMRCCKSKNCQVNAKKLHARPARLSSNRGWQPKPYHPQAKEKQSQAHQLSPFTPQTTRLQDCGRVFCFIHPYRFRPHKESRHVEIHPQ